MKDLFKIHGLAEYYVDNTSQVIKNSLTTKFFTNKYGAGVWHWRVREILEYLERFPQIKSYVVFDRMFLRHDFAGRHFREIPYFNNSNNIRDNVIYLLQIDM
jgi:hypothetical protein